MLLSRRAPLSGMERLRSALWPRRNWRRSGRYLKLRAQRLTTRRHSLALGVAAGVFIAILPIPGLQLLAAAGLAWLIRGHQGAAALGTFAANPVTYPLIWIASYAVGATILGTPVSNSTNDLDAIAGLMTQPWAPESAAALTHHVLLPILTTLLVGAVPLALLFSAVTYVGVRRMLPRRTPPASQTDGAVLVLRSTLRRMQARPSPPQTSSKRKIKAAA